MPVPDQVRDDGSGIQKCNVLKQCWIPLRPWSGWWACRTICDLSFGAWKFLYWNI